MKIPDHISEIRNNLLSYNYLCPCAVKVEGSSRNRDFVQGTILNPWNGPILWFSKGLFHNFPPNLQHRDIGNFMLTVLLFLRPFFYFWSWFWRDFHFEVMFEISNITSGEEIVKSTLFVKVCYVLYSGIKNFFNSLMRIRDPESFYPGSGSWMEKIGSWVNIPDPQHWFRYP